MDISGKCTVYAKEKEINGRKMVLYSAGISKKDGDKWVNFYLPISFKKGVVIQDRTKINIKQGWLDFYTNSQNNTQVIKIFANDFEILSSKTEQNVTSNDFETVENQNLPF